MNKRISMIIGLVFLMFLVACSNDGGSTDGNEEVKSGELKEVSIMLDWFPNAVHSYLYVAQEKGYFEEEGIKVDIQFPTNSTDPLNLVAANKVTLGLYYQPDVIMARANEDVPVKSLASIVRAPLNYTVFMKEKGLETPKDLEGKTVGYPGIQLNEALLQTIVEHDGGDFSKVEMIDVGFELNSAIIAENTDAVIGAFINHEVPVLEQKGYDVDYFNPVDYGVPEYNEIVLITSDETWKKEQEAIESFWKAAEKGFHFMKENPEEALEILLNNQDEANFPLDEEVEKQSLDVLLPKMEDEGQAFGSQDEETWEEVRDWLLDAGLIDTSPEIGDMIEHLE
ncbi:ABC transporter substrate-binding protein [Oceanobacillus senegalensis]|uniref:ABC transporter substrate-binding protein n=1 Tax=Oceanobacillus senegalensis TaxID=1936063 RepID=UPI000A30E7DD|nr:ABC transporter substrate-binding protein [Oceanobacillus senegalensis]